ncbi:unnamed protein product [Pleuronectes platessa]|uniref:Uncharacterized protein n=1 Tax=Pleuronectes platessa TaxID=8262 RepID=A0A9N7U6I0_PLEPL|nr:unnamed protein product [Pleuronectes platessa]
MQEVTWVIGGSSRGRRAARAFDSSAVSRAFAPEQPRHLSAADSAELGRVTGGHVLCNRPSAVWTVNTHRLGPTQTRLRGQAGTTGSSEEEERATLCDETHLRPFPSLAEHQLLHMEAVHSPACDGGWREREEGAEEEEEGGGGGGGGGGGEIPLRSTGPRPSFLHESISLSVLSFSSLLDVPALRLL